MDYLEFKKEANSECQREDEKKRIADELAHIEKMGLEKYMVLLSEIYEGIRKTKKRIILGGDYYHSYVLSNVVNPDNDTFTHFMEDEAKDSFFKKPLELDGLCILNYQFQKNLKFRDALKIVEDSVYSSNLVVRKDVIKRRREKIALYVISTSAISDEDFLAASKQDKMRTAEENERLMKYLIIKVRVRNCLRFRFI